jgi:DNA ligase-associated metallophosphoesterase
MAEALWQRVPDAPPTALAGVLVGVMGVVLEAFPEGALWWAETRMLVVADLHLEKGSSFARRGQLVPPYDTFETMSRLARLIACLRPQVVVALGDSFHDAEAADRLTASARAMLKGLQAGREWIWIAGNHDPDKPAGLEGMAATELAIGKLVFRHEPLARRADGEIAGHLHPCARVYGRGKSVRRRCFVGDGYRLVMPALGAYTGGLDIFDRAYAGLFAEESVRAFMLGDDRVYPVGPKALRPE